MTKKKFAPLSPQDFKLINQSHGQTLKLVSIRQTACYFFVMQEFSNGHAVEMKFHKKTMRVDYENTQLLDLRPKSVKEAPPALPVLPVSKLVKRQPKIVKRFEGFRIDGGHGLLKVEIRHDDQCGNGHNTFSITATMHRDGLIWGAGPLQDEITNYAPELIPLLKWHLVSSEGPMHYVANTTYHAREHGPLKAHVYTGSRCVKWTSLQDAKDMSANSLRYSYTADESTAKTADIEAARSCAVWPNATIDQLRDEKALQERLPALMAEFKTVVESLGLEY